MTTKLEEHLVRFRKLPKPVRVVYARPRTFIAIAIGIVAFFLLPSSLRLVTRLLIGWDILVAIYLLLVYTMVLRSGQAHIRRNAVLQDDGRFVILLVTALGAFASIAAIVFELGEAHRSVAELTLSTVTIAPPDFCRRKARIAASAQSSGARALMAKTWSKNSNL